MNSSSTPVRATGSPQPVSQGHNKPAMAPVPPVANQLAKAPAVGPITVEKIPTDRMLSTAQVSVILGVPKETLKKWRQRRLRPGFVCYHDGAVRYRLSEVLNFLDDSAVAD